MHGLCEIVPGEVLVEIGGREWWVGPLRLADYAEIERRVLQNRRSLLVTARAARATGDEIDAWLRSDEGILFELWLRRRSKQPAITFANVEIAFANCVAEVSAKMADAALRTGEFPIGSEFSWERDSTAERKPIPWRRIFRRLIESGVRPESVGTLSPAQLQIILLRTADQSETVQLTLDEAKELRARRSRQRDQWIEEQLAERDDSQNRLHRGIEVLASLASGMTNNRKRSPPASGPPNSMTEEPTLHSAMCDLANRIDELLATSLRQNNILRPDTSARFVSGP
jgi:hypothetical protein